MVLGMNTISFIILRNNTGVTLRGFINAATSSTVSILSRTIVGRTAYDLSISNKTSITALGMFISSG